MTKDIIATEDKKANVHYSYPAVCVIQFTFRVLGFARTFFQIVILDGRDILLLPSAANITSLHDTITEVFEVAL